MIDKNITNAQLMTQANVSANIITRLKRDNYISMDSVEKICAVMECGVDDILDFISQNEQKGGEDHND